MIERVLILLIAAIAVGIGLFTVFPFWLAEDWARGRPIGCMEIERA